MKSSLNRNHEVMSTEADWRNLYPFESHWYHLQGPRYHFVDEGRGDPLLMVHGNPTWSFHWRNLILAFRDRYRAIAPDHIGCGLSDKPRRYSYRLQTHIDNLVQLVDFLDLRNVTLLAHDWGGAIGLGAALERRERFSRFVLFNTGAFPPPYIPLRINVCRTPVLGRIALQGFNLFVKSALRMTVIDQRVLTEQVQAGVLAPYDSWHNRTAVFSFVKDIPSTPRHPTWAVLERIEAGLARLATNPFQLIWGMQDWCFTPVCLERFERLIPNARVHRIENAAHWVVEESHDEIVDVMNTFLSET